MCMGLNPPPNVAAEGRHKNRTRGTAMKKLVLATTMVALAAGSAAAADMGVNVPVRQNCPAAWFDGGYIGVNGGAVQWTANRTDQDGVIIDTTTIVQKKAGGVAGGQIGYNWTRCNTLFGVE